MRFLREVVLLYDGDECLIWPFSRDRNGYGKLRVNGRIQAAPRVVCAVEYGPPPTPDHEAAHSCGKGHEGCITKHHLRWATPAENCADMITHGTSNRGERHGGAKLTEADVRQIRALQGEATQREIAAQFGVHPETIGFIHRRETWAWLA